MDFFGILDGGNIDDLEEYRQFIFLIPTDKHEYCNFWLQGKRRYCKNRRKGCSRYCHHHANKINPDWNQDKPDGCPICFDSIKSDDPLECGHWVCINCMYDSTINKCPICRKELQNARVKDETVRLFELNGE